jgi:hypothetical protein
MKLRVKPLFLAVWALAMTAARVATSTATAEPTSTPQRTWLAAAEAMRAEDRAAIERCVLIGDEDNEGAAWMRVILDEQLARQRLHRISLHHFGRIIHATNLMHPNNYVDEAAIKETKRALEHATLKVEGTTARLVIDLSGVQDQTATKPAETQPATKPIPAELLFKRVGDEWKIDVSAMLRPRDGEIRDPRKQQIFRDLLSERARVWKLTADEIAAGRYKSFEDADDAASRR